MTCNDEFRWPGDRKVAVLIAVAVELWSPGHGPAYAPMASLWPVPDAVDTHRDSWVDYGVNVGVWRLLDLLGDTPATLGISGLVAERHPEIVTAAHRAGHEIAAHSWAQEMVPALLDVETERAVIARCTEAMHQLTGTRPVGWISPRATESRATVELLAQAGYEWFGDRADHDLPQLLDTAHGPLVSLLHSDNSDVRGAADPARFVEHYRELLRHLLVQPGPGVLRLTLHAHVGGRAPMLGFLGRLLDDLRAADDVWIATHAQAARHVLTQQGEF